MMWRFAFISARAISVEIDQIGDILWFRHGDIENHNIVFAVGAAELLLWLEVEVVVAVERRDLRKCIGWKEFPTKFSLSFLHTPH